MQRLTSISSDPFSQIHQFNWSSNVALNSHSTKIPSKNHSVSTVMKIPLAQAPNKSLPISPIGSHYLANRSQQSSMASKPFFAQPQLGGSAQLLGFTQPTDAQGTHHSVNAEGTAEEDQGQDASHRSVLNKDLGNHEGKCWNQYSQPKPLAYQFPTSTLNQASNPTAPSLGKAQQTSKTAAHLTSNSTVINPQGANSFCSKTSSRACTAASNQQPGASPSSLPRSTTTLWMGDLESWMDEDYVRRCVIMMGWHLPHYVPRRVPGQLATHDLGPNGISVKIKMVSGASPSSAYCFLTYPDPDMAEQAWRMISNMPPTLMPGCERTFKLNWATGLPGVQPTWDREFSVFIRDIDREVTEGELVSLFTCNFPSTKSAKIMGDLSTGLSRGYAFIRFGEESDMHRALSLGKSKNGTGMYLRGRCIKISEASGSSGTAGDHHSHQRSSLSGNHQNSCQNVRSRMSSVPSLAASDQCDSNYINRSRASAADHSGSVSISTPSNAEIPPPARHNSRDNINQATSIPKTSAALNSRSLSHHSLHLPLVPMSPVPITRPVSACPTNFTSNSSIPFRINSNPMNQHISRPVGALPQTVLPPSNLALSQSVMAQPNQPHHSISVPPLPMATSVARNPSCFSQPNIPQSVIFPTYQQVPRPRALTSSYPSSADSISPVAATSPHPSAQFYHQMKPRHEGYLNSISTASQPNSAVAHFAALAQISAAASYANNDPSNTTVFVGGLPACISEETLKTFFQNFGEITYVKIPPNKGCGFVQYVRRADAEQAMIKMHEFPIHGKSRIRLSWGRSLGDKQVEYVKKLSSALGISFESVWKIVQGQDHSTIKQIASVVSGSCPGGQSSPTNTLSPLTADSTLSVGKQNPTSIKDFNSMTPHSMSRFRSVSDTSLVGAFQSLPPHKNPSCYDTTEQQDRPFFLPDFTASFNGYNLPMSETPDSFCYPFSSSLTSEPIGSLQSSAPPSSSSNSTCHESLLSPNSIPSFEAPQSSFDPLSFSQRTLGRRATIQPRSSTTNELNNSSTIDSHQPGWQSGSIFSHFDPISVGSLESKWANFSISSDQSIGNPLSSASKTGTDDLSARFSKSGRGTGRGSLLGGLTEVEEEQVGDLTDERVGYRSHLLAHQLTSDDYSSASPPSMTHSSSQTANSQRESFGIGIEKLQASCDAWSLPSNDITCHPFQTSLNSYGDNLVFGLLRDSPPNGLSGPRSWEDTVKSLANKQSSVPDIQPNPNLRKTSGNLQEPLGFESLEKYWRTA